MPYSNLQKKKLRLCLLCLLIKLCCCHVNCNNLRWAEGLHFEKSCRNVPVPIQALLTSAIFWCNLSKMLLTKNHWKWFVQKPRFIGTKYVSKIVRWSTFHEYKIFGWSCWGRNLRGRHENWALCWQKMTWVSRSTLKLLLRSTLKIAHYVQISNLVYKVP